MSKSIDIYQRIPSQAEIAVKLGVTAAYVCMLLSGKRRNEEMLKKINNIIQKSLKAA